MAKLVTGLRTTLRQPDGKLYRRRRRVLPRRRVRRQPAPAQIRVIGANCGGSGMWQSPPFVDTVDKMQGQEADAVIVSYGVSDPEFAMQEAEFIYGLNRLNVAITRARSKCVVCLPRPLLEAPPQVLDLPEAARGLAFMRTGPAVSPCGERMTFELDDGPAPWCIAPSAYATACGRLRDMPAGICRPLRRLPDARTRSLRCRSRQEAMRRAILSPPQSGLTGQDVSSTPTVRKSP